MKSGTVAVFIYPENMSEIIWRDAVIEMLDRNTIRVGYTIYDRI